MPDGQPCRVGIRKGTVPLHDPAFTRDPATLRMGASLMARVIERRLPL